MSDTTKPVPTDADREALASLNARYISPGNRWMIAYNKWKQFKLVMDKNGVVAFVD